MKKTIAIVCMLAMLLSLVPLSPPRAAALNANSGVYQVGYARVDINPYVLEDDISGGIMALPLRGYGDSWNRLSTDGLIDDSGDGLVDEEDGLFATCIAITDVNGNAILLYTIDMIGGSLGSKARPIIAERVNAALESGELTGLQPLTKDQIQISGTHTHSSIASNSYNSNGKTGTNDDGFDLSVANEQLGTWLDRTMIDLGDAAIEALKDRSDARISKDQLSVRDATTPVLQNRRLNSIRHYNMEVDGDKFVGGNGFNAVDKWDYQNPDDYRTPRGVDPKVVSQVDDNMYMLRFEFPGTEKLPVLMVSWRGHPSINGGSDDGRISSDYVNAFCHALEYGCDVTFDSTNGFITDWKLGNTRKYRAAFFQSTSGNVNIRSDELVTYPGSAGDVVQYSNSWLSAPVYPTGKEAASCTYGVVLAQLALECVTDGLNETQVGNGDLRTMQMTYHAPWKSTNLSELGYEAAMAYQAAAAIKAVGVPYKYTSPETGEIFLISSKYHATNFKSSWNTHLNAPKVGSDQLTLNAITLGDDVAFLTMPGEPFDYYTKDTSLTGDALFAPENNLWNDLVDDATYGKPFVLGYCNSHEGYFPNEVSFDYNKGSDKWANGSYESHVTSYERGTGENMVRLYDQMLRALATSDGDMSYTAPCAHCGENQLWQPYEAQTSLTTGHYYLCTDVYTETIKVSGGQTVCLDLKGNTLSGATRALTTSGSTKDVVNIMDSSAEQTGSLQGCGALYGAARGLASGTITVADGDELNLYSGTLTAYQRKAYSANRGGVLYINGTFNMYGGQVTGGVASSFTGSYYSNGVATATKNGFGGCIYNAGICNFYGGTVTAGSVTSITGTITEPDADCVYTQEETPLADKGDCVWNSAASVVSLGGDARVEHLHFADHDGLNVTGIYTGSAEVKFNSLTALENMTVVGTAAGNADAGSAQITFTDAPGKTAAVKGGELVISDVPYSFITCPACGLCQWLPVTQADLKAVGENGLTPGHYRLTEDMTVAMRRLNKNGDHAGTYCIDLAGHTYTGVSRPFTVYSGAELNIIDTVGGGAVEGQCAASSNGSAIYLYAGGVAALYGGTLRHSAQNAVDSGGVVCAAGGHFSIHGGTIEGTTVTGKGGAISLSASAGFTATGGQVTMGKANDEDSCVYAAKGCAVTLSGTAEVAKIAFGGLYPEDLRIDGGYTGSTRLTYPASVSLEVGTVIGSISPAGDLSGGEIAVDATCKTVTANGDSLVIAQQHNHQPVITAPTCTEKGYTTYICACGDSYVSDEVAALGHRYETVTVDATCTEEGSATDTCAVCGDIQVHTIPATGHSHEPVITAPTCTEKGYTTYTCACGDSYVSDEVAAVGHRYSGGVCAVCDACEHCGECQWISITEADLQNLQPGHYRLSESIEASQQQLGAGTYCIDLAGHTFTGATRAFYLNTDATLNILDSVGGGILEGKSGASITGGVIYIYTSATVNLYGGTLRHNTQKSETVTTGGVICVSGGAFNMYNGMVEGANVTSYGGAIMVSARSGHSGIVTVRGGQITMGNAEDSGDCVYVNAGCKITLSGNAIVDEIRFSGEVADSLEIAGAYTGTTALRYPASANVTDGSDIGNADNADLSAATITVVNAPCLKVEIRETDLVAKAAHSYETAVTAPTCTEKGYTTYTCACGHSYTADEVAALGHKYSSEVTTAAGCETAGVKTFTCSACGDQYTESIPATGHSYTSNVTAPTCTEKGYTTYTCACGDSYTADEVAALGHKYTSEVTTAAGCETAGVKTFTCSACGDQYTESIPATGHSYTSNVTAPTCTEKGYTTYTCACGDSYTADEVAALGHKYTSEVTTAAGCETAGVKTFTCSTCGDQYTESIPATGHSHKPVVTAPTCTDKGYTTYTCACGDSYVSDEVAAVGHRYSGGVCAVCDACEHCGACQWICITEAEMQTLQPGHYRLSESIEASQQQLGSGTYCIDLAGHTFTGATRAFYLNTDATLNIMDSVGGGILEGKSGASITGGVIYIYTSATVNLYGGTLRHNTQKSETVTTGGVICVSGGAFNMYNGTVEGANVTSYGGAIMVSARSGHSGIVTVRGGQITMGHAEDSGDCVYVNAGCKITLSGNATVDEIRFSGEVADSLEIAGAYTGTTALRYPASSNVTDGSDIGNTDNADLSAATITVVNAPCLKVEIRETDLVAKAAHSYETAVTAPTCTEKGYTTYTCACGHSYTADEVAALGHSFAEGICGICGAADPDYVKPTLTLKSPTLEFKDMITVNAMFTAENIDDVVEMGMITYTEKVAEWNVETAAHVIPGTTYDADTGRYIAHSQGINAKYLGDTVYLACYAKLSDGSFIYTKLAPYSPVQYATNQLKNSSDMKLKQLVAAMLNYGAQAQLFFGHNTDNLANATLTDEQKLLPEAYRSEMVSAVPTASAEKQGIFANNKGFAKRYPSISFEGAFCINYFFKPNYAPVGDITLYYWNESDFEAAEVLTKENASGCMTLSLEDSGEYRGDIEGIAAKNLSASVFVAAVYSDGTTQWSSGVLGYSIGAYCGSQISKGADVAALAEATAVYGYHAKAYFG